MKLYTVEEATRALPEVQRLITGLRGALEGYWFESEQADDLKRMWGTAVDSDECPDHHAYMGHVARAQVKKAESEALLLSFAEMGVEVKDPVLGLVDFRADRDGETVYLCWQEGEPDVGHWHRMDAGFQGRQPL